MLMIKKAPQSSTEGLTFNCNLDKIVVLNLDISAFLQPFSAPTEGGYFLYFS